MKTRRAAARILAVFFTIMLLLTLFAEDLYNMTLPKVATVTSARKVFPYEITGDDGRTITIERVEVAVPEYTMPGSRVYVLTETEEGSFVEIREIKTGKTAGGWTEVTEGLSGRTKVVIGSDRRLKNGGRVIEDGKGWQVSLYRVQDKQVGIALGQQYYRICLKSNLCYIILAAAFTLLLISFCKILLKGRRQVLWSPVMILWCVLVCLYLRRFLVIPPEWIPERLIDLRGWVENIKRFWI